MIKIAICDDESIFGYKLKSLVERYLSHTNEFYEIDVFNSGKAFTELGPSIAKYHIIFLDINMKDMDGIKTASKIREFLEDVYVVFVTAFINYTLDGYKVKAFRYLLKNTANFEDALYECMDSIFKELNIEDKQKTLKFIEGEQTFSVKRLQYVESNLHKLTFHIVEKELIERTVIETLNNIEHMIDDNNFLRIHQSYLVNLLYADHIEGYNLILIDNKSLPIAKSRFASVKKRIYQYRGAI